MTGPWTRWQISTAIEKGKPLPSRLVRKIRRDPECRRFYEASLAMVGRLPRDAAEIVRHEQDRLHDASPLHVPEPIRTPPLRPVLRRRRLLALAVAVAILALVVGAGIWWRPSTSSPAVPPGPVAAQEQDLRELMGIVRQLSDGADRVAARESPRWRERVARSRDVLRAPIRREVSNMAADTRGILQGLLSIIPSQENPPGSDSEDAPPSPSSSGRNGPPAREETSLACSRLPAEISL